MRVLVSVDMEGIAAVVHRDDILPGHSEYERHREQLAAEANAAVRGVHAYQAGAQVLVTEAHADFRNLLPEALDRRAELLRGTPKPGGMMAGLAGWPTGTPSAHSASMARCGWKSRCSGRT